MGKMLSLNEAQSSSLEINMLDFQNYAPFQNQSASKATGIEN